MSTPPIHANGSLPSFFRAAVRVCDLSLGRMLWSRRTVFMALVVGAPVLMAVVLRTLVTLDLVTARGDVNGRSITLDGLSIFRLMFWGFYLRFSVPVLGVFYGTALIADEVEDKTITYLFTRPLARGAVLLGKYFAYLGCTALVVLPSVMLVFFLVAPMLGGSVGAGFPDLVAALALLAVGLAVYGALFALVGAWFRRPLLTGLVFIFGWEPIVAVVPGYMKRFTVSYYLQGLVPDGAPQDGVATAILGALQAGDAPPSVAACLVALGLILLGALVLATRVVEHREYVLEQ